jgi:3-oxoacyl-[acyl-carrier-protein] synthase-3
MRVEGAFVAAAGAYLPGEKTGNAVRETAPVEGQKGSGVEWLPVEAELSAAEMAVQAVWSLAASLPDPRVDPAWTIHAVTHHQGQDLAPVASYISAQTFQGTGPAFELRQMSNGGLAAMDIAIRLFLADPEATRPILISAGERYCLPAIDRWRTDPGTPYGDGAAALLLSPVKGPLRILSCAVVADSTLEAMHRSNTPFTASPRAEGEYIDYAAATRDFIRKGSLSDVIDRIATGQRDAIDTALQDAGCSLEDIRHFVLPHFGWRRTDGIFLRPFGIRVEDTQWHWSRHVGHLGAADQFAGMDHLMRSGRLRGGDKCLLIGVGAGYSWSAVVLESIC